MTKLPLLRGIGTRHAPLKHNLHEHPNEQISQEISTLNASIALVTKRSWHPNRITRTHDNSAEASGSFIGF
jgi:hypothetical protein